MNRRNTVLHAFGGFTLIASLSLCVALGACAKPSAAVAAPRASVGQSTGAQTPGAEAPFEFPPVNCSAPPPDLCCKALTAECVGCRERGSVIARVWNQRCIKNDGVKPNFVACDPLRPNLPCTPNVPMKPGDLR